MHPIIVDVVLPGLCLLGLHAFFVVWCAYLDHQKNNEILRRRAERLGVIDGRALATARTDERDPN